MIRKTNKTVASTLLAACLTFCECAKEGMPPGGPEDTTPPEVLAVSPTPDATHVDVDSKIKITFSERMLARITEESIFISPLPEKPPDFSWKGRELVLMPQEPLQPERTYVISIGTDAQDLRRNRLSQSYTFAFSTGSRLDYRKISGEVWTKKKVGLGREMGISIWAYLISEDRTEIDPEKQKPDYVTQANSRGEYVLENLSAGEYRLFAVQDVNRDLAWDWEKEAIGMTTKDVELTEQVTTRTDVDFILARRDKAGPSLLRCFSTNRNLVRLEFDEELAGESVSNPDNFKILPASAQRALGITSVFFQDTDTRRIFLLTEQTSPGEEYQLSVLEARDKAGNLLDTTSNMCLFEGSEAFDTLAPQITRISPQDGETDVPFDAKTKLTFDEPPDRESAEAAFSLIDSNQIQVSGRSWWCSSNEFVFSPDSLLCGNMKYQIKLLGAVVSDLLGNRSTTDSAFTSSFVTSDPANMGAVSGSVEMVDKEQPKSIVLTLWSLEKPELSYQIMLARPDSFFFERVLPGKYFLGGYIDSDGNGDLSLGQTETFVPLEPFTTYADTIRVRPRWETEGLKLTFP